MKSVFTFLMTLLFFGVPLLILLTVTGAYVRLIAVYHPVWLQIVFDFPIITYGVYVTLGYADSANKALAK